MVTNDNLSQRRLVGYLDDMMSVWSGCVGQSAIGSIIRVRVVIIGE